MITATADASSVLSRLTLIPLRNLVSHEDTEPSRLHMIAASLIRSGTLRNPILVTPLAGDKWLIIDGAHRTLALGRAGAELVLAQVFEPGECVISSWHHWMTAPAAHVPVDDLLTGQCPQCHDAGVRAVGRCLATVHGPDRVRHAWCGTADIAAAVRLARELAARYASVCRCRRVLPDDRREPAPTRGSVRIAHRPWSVDQLRSVVSLGLTLPAGVTRFVAPGRVLGVDVPLGLMSAGGSANASLDAVMRHVRQRRLRYYAEPVFLAEQAE